MFTEEERKQLDELMDMGFVDSFRKFHKEGESLYLVAILCQCQGKKPRLAHRLCFCIQKTKSKTEKGLYSQRMCGFGPLPCRNRNLVS